MSVPYKGSLEDAIEKYDLRYDEELEFPDDVHETEDYLITVQKIIGVVD